MHVKFVFCVTFHQHLLDMGSARPGLHSFDAFISAIVNVIFSNRLCRRKTRMVYHGQQL